MKNRSPHIVLIVEHHDLLKSVTADIIGEAGVTALQASDADEALAILKSRSDIAVLLTSVAMPGRMDGLGLAHRVSECWPAIKIIIASSQVRRMRSSSLPVGSRFFPKPYLPRVMISEIHAMIRPQTEIRPAKLVLV